MARRRWPKSRHDLTGQRFGRLIAQFRGSSSRNNGTRWWCTCDCGKYKLVITSSLIRGQTKSCGCFRKGETASLYKQGSTGNRVWRIWYAMMGRCGHRSPAYAMGGYAGRGIYVDPVWHDFGVFEEWSLANGYADHLSIDRIDNDGPYSPENCRWATTFQQANNKRCNVVIMVNGSRYTMAQASRHFKISQDTIRKRLKLGVPPEIAVKKINKAEARALYEEMSKAA